ncbi:hypothetical protein [Kiloniella antarctica]|uniref:Uncharacterized protein n=1 Tax=Kiloniella antarctica TaxID=1550907 RepID=A0ABW5BJP6_9PROT
MFGRVSRDNAALVPFLTLRIEFARFCDWLTKRTQATEIDLQESDLSNSAPKTSKKNSSDQD